MSDIPVWLRINRHEFITKADAVPEDDVLEQRQARDRFILDHLGSMTTKQMAVELHLSHAAIINRIKRMKKKFKVSRMEDLSLSRDGGQTGGTVTTGALRSGPRLSSSGSEPTATNSQHNALRPGLPGPGLLPEPSPERMTHGKNATC